MSAPLPGQSDFQREPSFAALTETASGSLTATSGSPALAPGAGTPDDEEEEFVYPSEEQPGDTTEEYTDSFSYPGVSASPSVVSPTPPPHPQPDPSTSDPPPAVQANPSPSPAQLEAIYAAASSGDIAQLRRLFRTAEDDQGIGAFALSNDATSRTGLTPLHAACSRGHLDIVQWLIEDCGAMTDLEDKEGETALHKAALNGHLDIVKYLLTLSVGRADVHTPDGDGYTALHNACSKGYLDVVRYLCEEGGACDFIHSADGSTLTPGVDIKSKGGWTPLMNAASKGHLPVVRYLLAKRSANPLVRNNWGETAFDIAAAVFEIFICEVLQQAEAGAWRKANSTVPYNPLAVHTTVPVILYEHQRLDSRIKTLAVNGGRPKFSAYHLGREGRRAPFELVLWGAEATAPSTPGSSSGDVAKRESIPAWRGTIQLPSLEESFVLPKPSANAEGGPRDGAERSHFWMSEWTLDLTHPRVDVHEGWQYARVLDDSEDKWSAEQPPQLERLLGGSGIVQGMTSSASSGSPSGRMSPNATVSSSRGKGKGPANTKLSFARRRRWVRVMRRRLDITPLPFLQPDGRFYSLTESGELIPYVSDDRDAQSTFDPSETGGVELSSTSTNVLSSHQDYVARARYLAEGNNSSRGGGSPYVDPQTLAPAEIKRNINKLSRAVSELRLGILSDGDKDRKTHAEVLINTYNRELERTRLAAGAQGIYATTDDQDVGEDQDDDNDSEDSFHYPGTPASAATPGTTRPASIRSYHTDYFSLTRSSSSRPADLTPTLAQATEFRVPTHDAPQKVATPRPNAPVPHAMHSQWERDASATECRSCRKRFTFYFRKHHCRRCGKVYCNGCSSHRALLDPSEIVSDPSAPEERHLTPSIQRVCQPCYDEVTTDAPGPLRSSRNTGLEGVMVNQRSLAVPGHIRRGDDSSQISDLADCPVCGQNLSDVGPAAAQERHVRDCLDGGSGPGASQAGKYIVYKLPPESVIIGTECVICLEEFEKATLVARLSCLCTFHNHCLSGWLQRGHACPVHARDQ